MRVDPQQMEPALAARSQTPLSELFPPPYVLPRYDGRSLANLPPTVGQLLGIEEGWVAPPLEKALLDGLDEGVERVIVLLVDGIGWRRLWDVVRRHDPRFLEEAERWGARVSPITSVSPATTSAATTTLWSNGAAPAEHGILGYTVLLAEQAALCNLLFWKPVGRGTGGHGELEEWGLSPESFLPVPSTAQVLAAAGVVTTALMPVSIKNSPLSRMQMRGARVIGYENATDLWLNLQGWLHESVGSRAYCYAYYPDFDIFSHRDGPGAYSWEALWLEFRFHLDRFLQTIRGADRANTLLIFVSDHGHVFSPPERRVLLSDHPALMEHLLLLPGGEARHNYLYVRSGHHAAVREYCESYLSDSFYLVDGSRALQHGLYGPPERMHHDAARRVGDFVLLSKDGYMLWTQSPDQVLLGMHGSLEPEEMIVPFVSLRLDA